MTDTHRHEWDMAVKLAYCIRCDAILKQKDIMRYLNAVECLSEVQARILAGLTSPKHKWNVPQTSA